MSAWQKEVLVLVAQGYSRQEIADKMGKTVKAVDKLKAKAMKKAMVSGVARITHYVIGQGWLKVGEVKR